METLRTRAGLTVTFLTLIAFLVGSTITYAAQDRVRVIVHVDGIELVQDKDPPEEIQVVFSVSVMNCISGTDVLRVRWPSPPAQIAMDLKEGLIPVLYNICGVQFLPREITVFMGMAW